MVRRDEDEPAKPGIERHIQTIVTSITLALLLWTGMTLVDLRDRLARMEERISSLSSQVLIGTQDRFTGSDWRREKEIVEDRFQRLERDLANVARDQKELHNNGRK